MCDEDNKDSACYVIVMRLSLVFALQNRACAIIEGVGLTSTVHCPLRCSHPCCASHAVNRPRM